MKWHLYQEIKKVTAGRVDYYLTKNEMKQIMNRLDSNQIRLDVFKLYSIPVQQPLLDPPHEILKRAHYTYISDKEFDQNVRNLKQAHEAYITLMLENIDYCNELEQNYAENRG